MSSKVKVHNSKWKSMHVFLLAIYDNFMPQINHSQDIIKHIYDLAFQGHPRSKVVILDEFLRFIHKFPWVFNCNYMFILHHRAIKCNSIVPWPWFDLSRSSKVKVHNSKWKPIYGFLLVIYDNFMPQINHSQDISIFMIFPVWSSPPGEKKNNVLRSKTVRIFFFEKCSCGPETQNNAKISDFWDIKISHSLNMGVKMVKY